MVIFNDCELQYITSDLITEFINDNPNQDFTLTLEQTCCCGTDTVSTEITIDALDIQNYRLPTLFPSGLHNIKLIKETTTSRTVESLCFFNECGIQCKIVELVANGNHTAWEYFEALRLVNICDSCTCDKACVIWQELSKILNQEPCAS